MNEEVELKKINSELKELYANLTPQKKKFVKAYLTCSSIAKASKIAGYSSRQAGHRMMTTDDKIKKILQLERLKLFYSDSDDLLRIAFQIRIITERSLDRGDLKSALRSLELELKARGFLAENSKSIKEELVPKTQKLAPFIVENMSEQELKDLRYFLNKSDELNEKHGESWYNFLSREERDRIEEISFKSRLTASSKDIMEYFESIGVAKDIPS